MCSTLLLLASDSHVLHYTVPSAANMPEADAQQLYLNTDSWGVLRPALAHLLGAAPPLLCLHALRSACDAITARCNKIDG